MLQLRCTGKVQKGLGLKPSQLSDIKNPDSILGNWYVNLTTIDRRKTLLFVSERTLLSFIIFGVKKASFKKMNNIFINGLTQLLEIENFSNEAIEKVTNEYADLEYTKTESKKVLGNMNDLMSLYQHYIYSDGGLKECSVGEIILQINRTPQRNIGWSNSITVTKEILQ